MSTKVAVVGAGVLGLMALKNFAEDGFDITGFEARPYVGGLWKNSSDAFLSVFPTTVFNSSKYRSSISDFPFPEDTNDFPTAPQMYRYLEEYSDHFGLTSKIQFNTRVLGLEREGDKWALTVQSEGGPSRTEYFDKVAVSTGSFSTPKKPQFKGVEHFAGSIIHAIDYHDPEPFRKQNVLIIGTHASAQDVAASLKGTARKVYMSHRHGLLLLPRYMSDGAVFDAAGGLRFLLIQTFLAGWLPRLWDWLMDKIISSISRKAFNVRPEWNFLPAPSMAVSTPLVGDELYALLNSGFATPVAAVSAITGPRSVLLADGTELKDVDSIVQCTGYNFEISFIPKSSPYQPYPRPQEPPYLYRNVFPLHHDANVRNSLAFLGQVAITFPGFVMAEMISQSVSQIWRGRATLPPLREMERWHANNAAWRQQMIQQYGPSSTFYVAFVPFADHVRWVDRTSGAGVFAHFDWAWFNWRSWRLWWSDRDLYKICVGGLLSPAVWRLFDCGGRKAWPGARDQIFRDNELVRRQKEEKVRVMSEGKELNGTIHENGGLKKDL